MSSKSRLGNKPNERSVTERQTPPAGVQTAYCPRDDCEHELSGRGTVDASGCATTDWRCHEHGYIIYPDWGGA